MLLAVLNILPPPLVFYNTKWSECTHISHDHEGKRGGGGERERERDQEGELIADYVILFTVM